MKIGELAGAAGVSARSLRYYEEQGLLSPTRTPGGQREYGKDEAERVEWIQQLYAAGLSSKTIRQLLPCVYTEYATAEVVARLEEEHHRLAVQIRELEQTRERLDNLIGGAKTSSGCSATSASVSSDAGGRFSKAVE